MGNGTVALAERIDNPGYTITPAIGGDDFRKIARQIPQRVRRKPPKIRWRSMDRVDQTGRMHRDTTGLKNAQAFIERRLRVSLHMLQDLVAEDKVKLAVWKRAQIN